MRALLALVLIMAQFESVVSWRDYRTYSPKMRIASDFLTNSGPVFSARPQRTPTVLYGGAAWGSKSYWLRSMAFELNFVLRELGFPNQWGVLLCCTYPDLVDRHVGKFDEEFQGIGAVQETTKRGLHVKFGDGLGGVYLRNIVSSSDAKTGKASRRGAEYAWVLGDELTEWTRSQFGKVMYTARTGWNLPFFARGFGTNPDGVGHGWVKEMFVPDYRDHDDPIFKIIPESSFLYVQALKTDNPAYAEMGDVIDGLIAMEDDPDIRRARDTGDWDIYSSGRFSMFRKHLVSFAWPEFYRHYGLPDNLSLADLLSNLHDWGFELYASLDYGTSARSSSVYMLHLVGADQFAWTFHVLKMVGLEAEQQAAKILELEESLKAAPGVRYADPSIASKKAHDQGGLSIEDRFRRKGVSFRLADNERVMGAATMAAMLDYERPGGPNWRIHESCKDLLKEIPALPRDPLNPEDVWRMGGIWHFYDSARYFLHTRFRGWARPKPKATWGSAAWFEEQRRQAREARNPRRDLFA